MEKRSPEEEAEFAAESLWEPDWKKMLVDSNAVILMSGRSSLLQNLAGKSNGDGVFRMPVMLSELGNFSCWQKIQFQDSHPHVSNVVFVEILIFGGNFKLQRYILHAGNVVK